MLEYKEIINPEEKSTICNDILRSLPAWFGVEASIVEYTNTVHNMPFQVAYDPDSNTNVGFIALKIHNEYTAEVYVIGVTPSRHHRGIGRELLTFGFQYCANHNMSYLTVKTLDASRESRAYERTRLFYYGMGFKPLEVFETYWDKDNPCLFMVKSIF